MISEAIVAGTPVIASRIAGNVGLLGEEYPGYFDVGDTRNLARLLWQTETGIGYLAELKAQCKTRAALFDPAHEKNSWSDLLGVVIEAKEIAHGQSSAFVRFGK